MMKQFKQELLDADIHSDDLIAYFFTLTLFLTAFFMGFLFMIEGIIK